MTTSLVLPDGCSIGPMRAGEVPLLGQWAAGEGWNPGVSDLAIVHAIDPDAFLALRHGEEMIGGGVIYRAAPMLGFMGLFIVRPDRRGQGLGTALWFRRRDLLLSRLEGGATIGMDGVFDMVPFYERGGFRLSHRDLRFQGIATGTRDDSVEPLDARDRDEVVAMDAALLGADRKVFLERWLAAPGARTAGLRIAGRLRAIAALRPARNGYRFGPVLAESADDARRVMSHLMADVQGQQVQLDVPEPNVAGITLAKGYAFTEVFGCARMYLGPIPRVDVSRVFGVTSFEFG